MIKCSFTLCSLLQVEVQKVKHSLRKYWDDLKDVWEGPVKLM